MTPFLTSVTNTLAGIQAARERINAQFQERNLEALWTSEVLSEAMSEFTINIIRVGGNGELVADTVLWFFNFIMGDRDDLFKAVECITKAGYTNTSHGTPVAACSALSALLGLKPPQSHLLASAILGGQKAYRLQQLGIA